MVSFCFAVVHWNAFCTLCGPLPTVHVFGPAAYAQVAETRQQIDKVNCSFMHFGERAMKKILALGLLVLFWMRSSVTLAQVNTHDLARLQQLQEQQLAVKQAEQAKARRAAGIEQRRLNAALKDHQAYVVQLDKDAITHWAKKKGPKGPYYQFNIERPGRPVAVALYSQKWGYAVDGKYQSNGLPWKTLDDALAARFSSNELWGLPDIPGWAKSHLLTGAEHVAEIKRKVLAQAEPQAVRKMADGVAYEIANKLGPKITREISEELGLTQPPQKQEKIRLVFQPILETEEKVYFEDEDSHFLIFQYKDGGGYEVFRQVPGHMPENLNGVFKSLEEAITFASEQRQPEE